VIVFALPDTPYSALETSALGQKQTSRHVRVSPLKADIHQRGLRVRLVPLADISAYTGHSPYCYAESPARLIPQPVTAATWPVDLANMFVVGPSLQVV
jgi:hypothetical protein